jgi:hypothetical protein
MFNARHPFTVPREFTLVANPISQSWQEGYGIDVDAYIDTGHSNWISASSASSGITNWTSEGGTYITGAAETPLITQLHIQTNISKRNRRFSKSMFQIRLRIG